MNQQILSLIVFVCVSFLAIALLMVVRELIGNGRIKIFERLGIRSGESTSSLDFGERLIAVQNDQGTFSWLRNLLVRAGLFTRDTSVGIWLIAGVVLLVGGVCFLFIENILIAAGAGGFAFVIVVVVLLYLGHRRINSIREQLPNAMDLLARALRAGESIDQAVALVGRSSPAPLGTEFQRCARQLEMGLSLSGSMNSFVRRVPILESRILASSLSLQKKAGGSLSRTLERLSRVFRDRLQFYRRYRTVTAASRLSIFVISLAAPCVFLYLFIWQSDYLDPLLNTANGQRLLLLDIVLLVTGLIWSFRYLQSEA